MSSFLFNMADTAVAITAGTGTNIDTRTEGTNGNHRQVVVLGDPATNAGVAPVDATAGLKVDLGSDNDITGTVTANLSATDNAVLDDIASDTEAIKTSLAGTLTVDGTVAVTNAEITTIAGAVSGTEMQVDVLTMPTTTVTATDLDIRPLVNTDVVTAELSATDNAVLDTIAAKDFATQTTLAAINAKMVSGTDIGDVTINNASGASAVNIQDGGNTITVDYATTGSGTATGALRVELPTNGTGVVGLNAGTNNIGDVDVLTVPRSLSGPGQPGTAIDSYTHAAINLGAGNNQVLVSSAANKQIWVYGITFTTNVAGTVSFQDEDDTAISGVMNIAANSGLAIPPSGNFSMPIWKLGTDKDLEVDIATAEVDGFLTYAIVSV